MPLACIYHPFQEMKVVSFEERDKLVASGEWFDHPTKAKQERTHHEEQIRRKSEQGSSGSECTPIQTGSGTRKQKPVREKGSK
jgi:hypothetical protein